MSKHTDSNQTHHTSDEDVSQTKLKISRPIERGKMYIIGQKRLTKEKAMMASRQRQREETAETESTPAHQSDPDQQDDAEFTTSHTEASQDAQAAKSNATTRQEHKQHQKQEQQHKRKKERRRILPIWLRLVIILVLSAIALIAGLAIGYSVFGGEPLKEVFNWDTWQHIIDIVNKTD